jgi:hypothetical protein
MKQRKEHLDALTKKAKEGKITKMGQKYQFGKLKGIELGRAEMLKEAKKVIDNKDLLISWASREIIKDKLTALNNKA